MSRPSHDGRRCAGITRTGAPCGAPPRSEQDYCWFHEVGAEADQARRSAASTAGQRSARSKRREPFSLAALETVEDARKLLGRLVGILARNEITASEGNTIRSTCNDFVRALQAEQVNDQERRLSKMADTIAELREKMKGG